MGIRENLENDLKTAMKAHDEERKRVYRMALSSIKFAEKEQGKALEEESVQSIIQKEIKIRNEMVQDAVKAGREDTIAEIKNEIAFLEAYLPKQLSQEELQKIIREVIAETQAAGPADMGKVMKQLLPRVKGLAANDLVSREVKEILSNL